MNRPRHQFNPFAPPASGPMYDEIDVPGFNIPARRGEDRPGLSPWGHLAKEGAVGHTTNLEYDATSLDVQEAANDMVLLAGDDLDACQVVVTLGTPRAVPRAVALIEGNVQNATGEGSNFEYGDTDFPGSASPIAWPPIDAIVEFGTGGAKHKAYVDFVNGMQFSVTASYLRIKAAVIQSQEAGGFKGTSAVYTLAATTAPGFTRANATKTIYVGDVDTSAESAVFAIPPFARRATVYLCDNSAIPNVTACYLRFWQSPDGQAGGSSVGQAFVSGNTPGPFAVPANGYFSVYNQSAVGALIVVVFDLGLG